MSPAPDEAAVFNVARKLPTPAERRAYLDATCGADTALRERVARLLAAHEADTGFLAAAANRPADTPFASPPANVTLVGTTVGPFTLTRVIGEGGMGTVYRAEQTEPVRRAVAVKVIRAGLGGRAVLARFEVERQALARMDHPHIARVLDAGSTPDGRPFFAMELVDGSPITPFCDDHRLCIRDRLELFGQVCRAVQHAHQKGIIHRDLKPSNVLVAEVDRRPLAKVIDFGVAKATDVTTGNPSADTGAGSLVGTLAYMAPEQAEFDRPDVDTRADVYALGTILFELLAGTPPFPAEPSVSPLQQLKTLRETDPDQPTTRLATADRPAVAAARATTPAALDRQVRGDLDWITLKCLEKDRSRRYDSAAALADDIERHLHGEPVVAAPPGRWYRVRKFTHRHRGAVLAATAVTIALVGGIVGTSLQAVRATRAEELAKQEANHATTAEEVATRETIRATDAEADTDAYARFLLNRVLGAARPQGVPHGIGVDVTLSKALAAAEPAVATEFAGRPRAEAAARKALGTTWKSLGRYDLAEPHLRTAVRLCEEQFGPDADRTLDAVSELAACLIEIGRNAEAVQLASRRVQGLTSRYGPIDHRTLHARSELGAAQRADGQYKAAAQTLGAALADQKATLGSTHTTTLTTLGELGNTRRSMGQHAEGVRLLTEAADGCEAAFGPADVRTVGAVNRLVFALTAIGRPLDGVPRGRATLNQATDALGADHPLTLQSGMVLGNAFSQGKQTGEALPLLENVARRARTSLPDEHPLLMETLNNLALAYQRAGRMTDALPLMADVRDRMIRRYGPNDPNVLIITFNLGRFYNLARRPADAVPLLRTATTGMKTALGPTHPTRAIALTSLMNALQASKQSQAMGPVMEELVAVQRTNLPANSPQLADLVARWGNWRMTVGGDPAAAEPLLREAVRVMQTTQPNAWDTYETMTWLGDCLTRQGDYPAAERLLQDGYKGLDSLHKPGANPTRDGAMKSAGRRLAVLYRAWGKPAAAREWADRAGLKLAELAPPPRPVTPAR